MVKVTVIPVIGMWINLVHFIIVNGSVSLCITLQWSDFVHDIWHKGLSLIWRHLIVFIVSTGLVAEWCPFIGNCHFRPFWPAPSPQYHFCKCIVFSYVFELCYWNKKSWILNLRKHTGCINKKSYISPGQWCHPIVG